VILKLECLHVRFRYFGALFEFKGTHGGAGGGLATHHSGELKYSTNIRHYHYISNRYRSDYTPFFRIQVIFSLIGYQLYLHKGFDETPNYVTSEKCQACHQDAYDNWRDNTLHPYMFLPVDSPDAKILGDFDSEDPAVTFTRNDIDFVLGSKWEQVYVTHIDGENYPLPAKWYVQQKRWVPYKVDSWKQTPLSYKCDGCHTTGFDPTTRQFAEYGIGCEACHGGGSVHIQNQERNSKWQCTVCHTEDATHPHQADIISSVSPSVCGQCHNRGKNIVLDSQKTGEFNFPLGFKPGDDLSKSFKQNAPKEDKKGQYWWGNGVSKNRHQEFADWSQSKHAQALSKLLEYGAGTERGALTADCLKCHSSDYRHSSGEQKRTLDSARFGIACIDCHEPHGRRLHEHSANTGTDQCAGCHIHNLSHSSAVSGKPHIPCPINQVSCADCHMPRIVKTGGYYSLRSHAFKIIKPTMSQESDIPNSCQNGGCHANRDLEWAIEAYKQHYVD
jgi:hypothetical protein